MANKFLLKFLKDKSGKVSLGEETNRHYYPKTSAKKDSGKSLSDITKKESGKIFNLGKWAKSAGKGLINGALQLHILKSAQDRNLYPDVLDSLTSSMCYMYGMMGSVGSYVVLSHEFDKPLWLIPVATNVADYLFEKGVKKK